MEGRAATGSGASLSAMYQDALLAHHRAPHNRRVIAQATGTASLRNPVCGDDLRVMVTVTDDVIEDAAFDGRGCSIATASASMMTDAVRGLSPADALLLATRVERMLLDPSAADALPEALAPLRGVAPFPGRHGCARMAWQALREALGGK